MVVCQEAGRNECEREKKRKIKKKKLVVALFFFNDSF